MKAKKRPAKQHSSQSRKHTPRASQGINNPYVLLSVVAIIAVGVMIYLFGILPGQSSANSTQQVEPAIEQPTNNVELENKVVEIASMFACSCGGCDELPLESCTCETAQQERQFIRSALQHGHSVEEVIQSVNNTYGFIEEEYQSQYGGGKPRLDDLSNKLEQNEIENKPVASLADRSKIIAQFFCNCGQCEGEPLTECDCDHPAGAREVKQFIDNEIQHGTHTVEEIIARVDAKYDNRFR